jgi:hypothetical protein
MKQPSTTSRRLRTPQLTAPKSDRCEKAAVILERAHDSADALLKAYELARKGRGRAGSNKPRGISTDDEQDLLRAMLVMAAAGLDSMLKQPIRDALPDLVRRDERVRDGFEKFIAKSVRGEAESQESTAGAKFLARVLAAPSQQLQAIEEYIAVLTGGSLQSASEPNRTASALGLTKTKIEHSSVQPIFDVRNKVIHELDINLDGDRRKRNHRGLTAMKAHAKRLLELAEEMLAEIDEKLTKT